MGKRRIGILGGSFNPVHNGHLMLASFIAQFGSVDEVWMVLSPSNPFKVNDEKAPDLDRLTMLRLAVGDSDVVKACEIELSLPRPSFTIATLKALTQKYPQYSFVPIIGSDNLARFPNWKDSNIILDDYGLLVYPRKGYESDVIVDSRIIKVDAPEVEISSTFIRNSISEGYDMNFFLPESVYRYIKTNKLYIQSTQNEIK